MTQFLQLSHNTISHAWYALMDGESVCENWQQSRTLSIQAIHHAADKDKLQLVLQAEIDKICVNKDSVWRHKFCIVGEEHR